MAMSEQERREFEELKRIVSTLVRVENVPFIETAKRRIAVPALNDLGLSEVISKNTTGNTSGVTQTVNESGSSSYNVADEYIGTITVSDTDGNLYKLGYYNA